MDASMAPGTTDLELAIELVRAMRTGNKLTADQLVATGQDVEIFGDVLREFLPHLKRMRGFKPCLEYYNDYRQAAALTIDGKPASKIHLLHVYKFDTQQQALDGPKWTARKWISVFLTRGGKWVVIDHGQPESDQHWHEAPFTAGVTQISTENPAEGFAALRHDFMSRPPEGARHTRTSDLVSSYNSWNRRTYYHDVEAESLALILAQCLSDTLAASRRTKLEELEPEGRTVETVQRAVSCFKYLDDGSRIVW